MQPMSKDKPTPLSLQVANDIRSKINDGEIVIEESSGILRIERTAYAESGSIVEFTRSPYRGDRYEFVSALS